MGENMTESTPLPPENEATLWPPRSEESKPRLADGVTVDASGRVVLLAALDALKDIEQKPKAKRASIDLRKKRLARVVADVLMPLQAEPVD